MTKSTTARLYRSAIGIFEFEAAWMVPPLCTSLPSLILFPYSRGTFHAAPASWTMAPALST